ncbi:MAG: hypothetical protein RI947_577 [Candidatus Parcubacteria bacterium]
MRNILRTTTLLLFYLIALFSLPRVLSAHPLDITYMDVHIFNDFNNNPLPSHVAVAEIYIPWLEASFLVQRAEKIASPEAKTLPSHQKTYADYITDKVIVYNEGKECPALYGLPPQIDENEILFGRGIMIPIKYECRKPLQRLTIRNSMFIEDFPVQRNMVNFYNGPEVAVKGALLTAQSQDFTVDTKELTQPITTEKRTLKGPQKLLDSLSRGFLETHKKSLLQAVILVFFLGLLHTLEAGHSKTVLASFLIQKKASIKDGMLFAMVFTVTHIADIVVLGFVLYITNAFVDVFSRLSYLQTFSLYALLFISVYMFFTNLAHGVQRYFKVDQSHDEAHAHTHDHDHGHSHDVKITSKDIKKQLWMGFLVGLSPCLFGWSIFMVILSTKQVWAVFPIILSFGLGIFAALALIVVIVGKLKIKVMDKYNWLGDLSPIISSLLLVIFALLALM